MEITLPRTLNFGHVGSTHANKIIYWVLHSLVGSVFDLVWLVFGSKYNLDITKESEIWHEGSTYKNMLTQGALEVFIGLVWLGGFVFSHPYSYLGWK